MILCSFTYIPSGKKEEIRYCGISCIEWVNDQDRQLSAKRDGLYSTRPSSVDIGEHKCSHESSWNFVFWCWKPEYLCSQISHCTAFLDMFVWGLFYLCEETAACLLTAKSWCRNILQTHNGEFGVFPLWGTLPLCISLKVFYHAMSPLALAHVWTTWC